MLLEEAVGDILRAADERHGTISQVGKDLLAKLPVIIGNILFCNGIIRKYDPVR